MTIESKDGGGDISGAPIESTQDESHGVKDAKRESVWRRVYNILTWTPPNCRWDPAKPPQFSMSMNVLFAFAAGCMYQPILPSQLFLNLSPYLTLHLHACANALIVTVANLYYNHPILNILAHDFGVRYEQVAQIPTVMQAGYAAGLLFLCPLGDLLPRRPFVCGLVFFTATMWYASNSLELI